MTAKELIKYLQKFDDDALIQIVTDEDVRYAVVDNDAPFSPEYIHEVCIFIGDII